MAPMNGSLDDKGRRMVRDDSTPPPSSLHLIPCLLLLLLFLLIRVVSVCFVYFPVFGEERTADGTPPLYEQSGTVKADIVRPVYHHPSRVGVGNQRIMIVNRSPAISGSLAPFDSFKWRKLTFPSIRLRNLPIKLRGKFIKFSHTGRTQGLLDMANKRARGLLDGE